MNLWDLAGSPDYLEVRNEFYKDSQAALLVYDVTNRPSFEALSSWVAEAAKYGAPSNMVSTLDLHVTAGNSKATKGCSVLRLLGAEVKAASCLQEKVL